MTPRILERESRTLARDRRRRVRGIADHDERAVVPARGRGVVEDVVADDLDDARAAGVSASVLKGGRVAVLVEAIRRVASGSQTQVGDVMSTDGGVPRPPVDIGRDGERVARAASDAIDASKVVLDTEELVNATADGAVGAPGANR